MKKLLALLCCAAVAVSCMLLASCGGSGSADLSDSEYVGTWVAQTIDAFKTKGDMKLTFKTEDGGITTNIVGANIHFVKQ